MVPAAEMVVYMETGQVYTSKRNRKKALKAVYISILCVCCNSYIIALAFYSGKNVNKPFLVTNP